MQAYIPAVCYGIFACLSVTGVEAADTCWIYDYEHSWSRTPYKRLFNCPCGCCGDSWTRFCCPREPVCQHNKTLDTTQPEEDNSATMQALMLAGIVVGTFCILMVLTVFMHMCGRIFLKKKMEENKAPQVIIYNVHEPVQASVTVGPCSSGMGKSGMEAPPSYVTATTTV
ncbi:uncharacterized protein LOC124143703 isoform X1 [Haliotis rufescens]|uniref:uncharacterized protein LOC124143703 isoform X1 n=1 Tax=Haliotis rufescens TaxID=6454 RepID=UPI001EAFE6D4|nr:uncharacterized protein LOC124143703 isoform X1 [Haliotis rufescens]